MTDIPFQPWYEADFDADPFVKSLPFRTQLFWRLVCQKLWANQGWLPAEEHALARHLGCDVRTVRAEIAAISPRLILESEPFVGLIYRQKRVGQDWAKAVERIAKNKARTAAATAARSTKSKKQANVTKAQPKQRNVDRDDDRHVDRNEAAEADRNVDRNGHHPEPEDRIGSASSSREPILSSPTTTVAALPPHTHKANGSGSADVGSPGLGGRSPPQPSRKVEEPIKPSPALLATPLVKKARTGLMAALDEEDDA